MPDRSHQPTELTWIFRPALRRPTAYQALAGMQVHATGAVGADGEADVVLANGTRVRVTPAELAAE